MAKVITFGKPHNIRVNDAAYFLVQKKIIDAREKGSSLSSTYCTGKRFRAVEGLK